MPAANPRATLNILPMWWEASRDGPPFGIAFGVWCYRPTTNPTKAAHLHKESMQPWIISPIRVATYSSFACEPLYTTTIVQIRASPPRLLHLDLYALVVIDLSLALNLNSLSFFFTFDASTSWALEHRSIAVTQILLVRDWVSRRRSQHTVRLITSNTQDEKSQIQEEDRRFNVVQS